MRDCLVVGGGPVGLYAAGLMARAGLDVLVFEEHRDIGQPVQCSGIVTPRVVEFVPSTKKCVRSVKMGAVVHGPTRAISFKAPDSRAVIIDRGEFDRHVHRWARDSGAEVLTGRRWRPGNGDDTARIIIGADGPHSVTASHFGFDRTGMEIIVGWQAETLLKEVDDLECVEVWLGRCHAPGFFAWSIPVEESAKGTVVRIGLGASPELLAGGPGLHELGMRLIPRGGKILRMQGGVIPIGLLGQTVKGPVLLLGDAAAQVKPTTGGGLYPGLRSAEFAARAVETALERDDIAVLEDYHRNWTSTVGDEIRQGMRLRRALLATSDLEMDEILERLNNRNVVRTIVENGDIDYPWKVAWALMRTAPGLIKYLPKLMG